MSDSLSVIQKRWTAHFRHPQVHPAPAEIEDRRLQIYRDLLYKNVEAFIRSAFPILRKITADDVWHEMVRDFLHRHVCKTPFFLEIAQEFIHYLESERDERSEDPAFLLELAHYEWVEIALDVAEAELDDVAVDVGGSLLESHPLRSPLAWSLAYQFPVHKIGPSYLPTAVPDTPTFLVVYRNRQDLVRFMEINAVTARMLELLDDELGLSGEQVLRCVAKELGHPQPEDIVRSGLQTLEKLHSLDIILGTLS